MIKQGRTLARFQPKRGIGAMLDPKKQAYWAEHERRWQASGLSQRQYCELEELSLSSFDRWRRLIRDAGTPPAKRATPQRLTLVPVQVEAQTGREDRLVLKSPAGWQVTLPDTWGEEALVR